MIESFNMMMASISHIENRPTVPYIMALCNRRVGAFKHHHSIMSVLSMYSQKKKRISEILLLNLAHPPRRNIMMFVVIEHVMISERRFDGTRFF